MKKNTLLISMITLLTLTGCGGGGGGSSVASVVNKVTGKFKDTYVAGLKYECTPSGTKAVTNSEGEYTCVEGDEVEFFLGKYSLGKTKAISGVITPKALYPDDNESEVNVAQLLQTVDETNGTGVITIPDNFDALDDVTIPPTATTFDDNISKRLQSAGIKALISETDAIKHLQTSYTEVLTDLVKGQTFYSSIENEANTLESLTFDATASTATWIELVGGSCHGSGTTTRLGMNITFTSTGDSCTPSDVGNSEILSVKEILDDYILVSFAGTASGTPQRLYFDEAKARAYFLADTISTKNLLAGKTIYAVGLTSKTLAQVSFATDMGSSTGRQLVGGTDTWSDNVKVKGKVITFTSKDPSETGRETITITDKTNDYLVATYKQEDEGKVIKTEIIRMYFNEAKARAYFLADTIATKNLLAGKTIYAVGLTSKTLAQVSFATDMGSSTGRQLVGGTDTWSDNVKVKGKVITFTSKDPSETGRETITITNKTNDYLVATYKQEDEGKVIKTETIRMYFNETKARAYLGNSTSTNLTTLLAGKTLYSTIYDQLKTLESWKFNDDATTGTWKELVGGSCTGSGTTSISGMNILFTATTDSCGNEDIGKTETLTVTEIKDDYISIAVADSAPQRLFFTEAKAREFYITNAVKNYFTGQTRYFANINGATGVRTYNTDGSYTGTVDNSSVSGTYTINGDTLTLTNTGANRTLALTHQGYNYNGEKFSITVTNADGSGGTTTTYQYRNASDRDAGRAKYIQEHP